MVCDRKQGSTLFLRSVAKTSTALVYKIYKFKMDLYTCMSALTLFYLIIFNEFFVSPAWGGETCFFVPSSSASLSLSPSVLLVNPITSLQTSKIFVLTVLN